MTIDRSSRHRRSSWGFGSYVGCLISVVGAVLGAVLLLGPLQADPPEQALKAAASSAAPPAQEADVRLAVMPALDAPVSSGSPERTPAVSSAPAPQAQRPPSRERPGPEAAPQPPSEVAAAVEPGGPAAGACGVLRGDFMRDVERQSEGSSRQDGRCGVGYPSSRLAAAECPPVGGYGPCCSVGGWCGGTRLHCKDGARNFRPGWQRAGDLPTYSFASELRQVLVKYVGCLDCDVTLVFAGHLDDLTWMEPLLSKFRVAVYMLPAADTAVPECIGTSHFANRSTLNFAMPNKGSEAGRYLAYIVQEYERLPDRVMFLHAEKGSWHDTCGGMNDGTSKLDLIQKWVWDRACIRFVPSYCKHLNADPPSVAWYQKTEPLWSEIHFPPANWQTPCCAQFGVTREEIITKTWKFYADLYDYIMAEGAWQEGSDVPGHYYEYMWAKMFDFRCPGTDLCLEPGWLTDLLHKPSSCTPQR